MTIEFSPRDVYARHTGKDGKSYVAEHRVWNSDLFFAARTKEAAEINAKDKGARAGIEQITRAQYLGARA